MNEVVINLPTLISRVSTKSNMDIALTRRFIHELFIQIENELVTEGSITVSGVGEFSALRQSDKTVEFIADKELASVVNAPFSAFKPVALNPGAEDAMTTPAPTVEAQSLNSDNAEIDDLKLNIPVQQTPAPEIKSVNIEEDRTSNEVVGAIVKNDTDENIATSDSYVTPPSQQNSKSNWLWLVLGIMMGLIVGLIGGYFAGETMGRYSTAFYEDEYQDEDEDALENADSISSLSSLSVVDKVDDKTNKPQPAVAAEAKSEKAQDVKEASKPAEEVYATVTKSLSSLAKEYYGHNNYWVFIYQANPQLKNPNQIAPGTKVLIPAYESFAGKTREETNEKANAIFNELSKKYKL